VNHLENRSRLARGADCLICSVGSFDDFSFEEAITRDVSSAREIHAFDHTVSNPRNKPCGVHFHPWGLGRAREPDGSDLKGLADIVVALGHKGRTIDVLKIDCEGCEWSTYGSWFDADVRVDEMLVEIHAGTIDSNLNEIHQSWLSLIVGEQFSAAARSTLRASRWRNVSSDAFTTKTFTFSTKSRISSIHDCTKCASNSHSFASMVVLRVWKIPQTRGR